MNRCKDCKFFSRVSEGGIKSGLFSGDRERPDFGYCQRWRYGYHERLLECPPNEVIVEDDEYWGAIMGPEFGCVLWEPIREAAE